MRPIGLHFRLLTNLSLLLERAQAIGSPVMQCFFIPQGANTYPEFSSEEIALCLEKRPYFSHLFLHASYWVNLAGRYSNGWRAFKRELELAKQFSFTHMVIHPGSATGCVTKEEGIEYLARALNKILKEEDTIKIVLENTAHAHKTVGGDIADFQKLLTLLDQPEKIGFCLDSAHAYSYGYDLSTRESVNEFVELVDQLIGTKKIVALHLNDAAEPCGSRIDKHEIPGRGKIGKEQLIQFMNHPKLCHVPVILETPILSEQEEVDILKEVQSWTSNDR